MNDMDRIDIETTTPLDTLNITLNNLNMTATDVKEKKDLTVPDLGELFVGLTESKSPNAEIIYGEKAEDEAKPAIKPARKPAPKEEEKPKQYINMDFGGGGRFRTNWNNPFGGGWGGGGGRLITNRKTSTTTRIPITYFDMYSEDEDDDLDLDLVAGDYEEHVDYQYYEDYDYSPYQVPTGVKSALIASSVVGGLAVSIFLCIFMLCLWKQMKNKLRMSNEYEEPVKPGFLSSLFYGRGKNLNKPEGYFNKVPPVQEQTYIADWESELEATTCTKTIPTRPTSPSTPSPTTRTTTPGPSRTTSACSGSPTAPT